MKVLVVEDDEPSRNYLKDTLQSQGHETYVAENGWYGLEAFKKHSPNLVLSDIRMPKMDGLELLEEIRKISRSVIVVMTTAYGCEEYALKALRLRANNYIKKPLRHMELLPLLKKYASIIDGNKEQDKAPAREKKANFTLEIENNLEKISESVALLIFIIGDVLEDTDKLDVRLGLIELLTNAIEHGNLGIKREEKLNAMEQGQESLKELYNQRMVSPRLASRKVKIEYKLNDTSTEWLITDEGLGFDWKSFLKRLETNPLQMESKGLLICKYHFDSLEFLNSGNQVRVRKLRSLK
jgi:YesN/AraC family two-component response regulator